MVTRGRSLSRKKLSCVALASHSAPLMHLSMSPMPWSGPVHRSHYQHIKEQQKIIMTEGCLTRI